MKLIRVVVNGWFDWKRASPQGAGKTWWVNKKNHLNLLITITKHYQLAFCENKGWDPNSFSWAWSAYSVIQKLLYLHYRLLFWVYQLSLLSIYQVQSTVQMVDIIIKTNYFTAACHSWRTVYRRQWDLWSSDLYQAHRGHHSSVEQDCLWPSHHWENQVHGHAVRNNKSSMWLSIHP